MGFIIFFIAVILSIISIVVFIHDSYVKKQNRKKQLEYYRNYTPPVPKKEEVIEIEPHPYFPHTLFVGPGGLGKTTLAEIIKNELQEVYGHEITLHALTPSQLKMQSDLDRLMMEVQPYDIIFIDEIHGLKTSIAESFYKAIESGEYHMGSTNKLLLGDGVYIGQDEQSFQTIQLPPFTCLAGTTEGGVLPRPLIMRFNQINLNTYSVDELCKIVENYLAKGNPKRLVDYVGQEQAKKEVIMDINALGLKRIDLTPSPPPEGGFPITEEAKLLIAKRSFGTPRIAIKYAKKCKAFALANNYDIIDENVVEGYMQLKGVDELGLTPIHKKIVKVLANQGHAMGTKALASAVNISPSEVENLYFPDLVFVGLGKRDNRSWKTLTEKGKQIGGAI